MDSREYAKDIETQEKTACAVVMRKVLRRAYFENLDRWVFKGK